MLEQELQLMVGEVRRFVRNEVMPVEQQIEDDDAVPERLRDQAKEMGLYGMSLPVEYGGLGMSMAEEAELVFELGYVSPAFRSMFGTNNGIAGHVVTEGGTEAQREAYLPRIASGEATACFCLTESEAGSDPAGLSTKAERTDAGYVLNGAKRYITNAPIADLFMTFARTGKGAKPADGISVFLVEAGTPGLSVGPRDKKMGQKGAWTSDVYYDDVVTPESAMIGGEGTGYGVAMRSLAHGRLHIAAVCVGMAQRLVDESVAFAKERRQGGKPIGEHQLVAGMLADMQTELLAGRALVLDAAHKYDAGKDKRMGPACAKYFASEMVGRVADKAVQIHGGSGYMHDVAVERLYRDARLFRIYEGTSQIQQLIIAGQLLR